GERHEPVNAATRAAFRRFAIAGVVNHYGRIGDAHAQDRVIAMGELTVEQDLLQVAQRRTHALHPLTELQKMPLNHRLVKSSAQEPRPKMAKIPSIEGNRLDVVAIE